MLRTLHLVRHGEVHNPDHIVYGDLDGFGLSSTGCRQADAVARRLAEMQIDAIVSSPLDRAVATAIPIAASSGIELVTDDRLTEWALGSRWAGVPWDDLPTRFPGEVEAYLAHPDDLDFTPETIADVAHRMGSVVGDLGVGHSGGRIVIVSHQDPIQALRFTLTDRRLSDLQADKPTHGCHITLAAAGPTWVETTSWTSEEKSPRFPPLDPSETSSESVE